MRILLLLLLFLVLVLRTQEARADVLPEYICPKVSTPIKIDGLLTEDAWKSAPEILMKLYNGGETIAKTTAKMCWDDKYLYVGYECEDKDIWGTMTNRDDQIYREEVVEIFFAPNDDPARYIEINLSPRNVVFDALIYNPARNSPESFDAAWNCKWMRTAVHIDGTLDNREDIDRGWSAELAIPFTSIPNIRNCPPKPGESWSVNLYRINLTPDKEFCCWSPTLTEYPAFHIRDRFGKLIFKE